MITDGWWWKLSMGIDGWWWVMVVMADGLMLGDGCMMDGW